MAGDATGTEKIHVRVPQESVKAYVGTTLIILLGYVFGTREGV